MSRMFLNKICFKNLCSFCFKQHGNWSLVGRKKYASLSRQLHNVSDSPSDNKDNFNEQNDRSSEVHDLLENSADFRQKDIPGDPWVTPVYPVLTPEQAKSQFQVKPIVDPSTTSVILFPGQGSQYVGMTKDLLDYPNVKEMYDVASEILGYDLKNLCLNGPRDMLNMTAHCQVAVMVASLAAVEKLRVLCPSAIENCIATAGFSVGEYTALVFAGAFSFEDAVRLLKVRGEAMQKASDAVPSGMMTVFVKPATKLKFVCAAAQEWCSRQRETATECCIATYLFPDCRVLAGNIEALKFIEMNAADLGIWRMKYIPVSGAFHSKLMMPAQKTLDSALSKVQLGLPLIQVHSNVDGEYYTEVKTMRKKLATQLCRPVMWEQTMTNLFRRPVGTAFPSVYECGPQKTMRAILKKVNAKAGAECNCIEA